MSLDSIENSINHSNVARKDATAPVNHLKIIVTDLKLLCSYLFKFGIKKKIFQETTKTETVNETCASESAG